MSRPNFPGWVRLKPGSRIRIEKGDVAIALEHVDSRRCHPDKGYKLDSYAKEMVRVSSYNPYEEDDYHIYRRVAGFIHPGTISEVASLPLPLP